jgi:hypothetical protein
MILIAACAVLVAVTAMFVLKPLFRETEGSLDIELLAETELDRLLSRKAVVYNNLRDLEFEFKMDRLSDDDFHQLESGYKDEAITILRKLEQLGASENLDESIERDIAARRAALSGKSSKESQDADRCPSCGAEIIAGKRFCADCGHKL